MWAIRGWMRALWRLVRSVTAITMMIYGKSGIRQIGLVNRSPASSATGFTACWRKAPFWVTSHRF